MNTKERLLNERRMNPNGNDIPSHTQGLFDLIDYIGGINDKKICEVGSFRGVSSEVFLSHQPKEATFVDIWGKDESYRQSNWAFDKKKIYWDEIKKEFIERVGRYKDKTIIKVFHDYSDRASLSVDESSLDFVYLDGDHSKDAVIKDIENWLPKIKQGGFLCGHDYHPPVEDRVKDALDEFFGSEFIKENIATFSDRSFAIKK